MATTRIQAEVSRCYSYELRVDMIIFRQQLALKTQWYGVVVNIALIP